MWEINDFVSLTSRLTAAVRAIETEKPEHLFEDPWAAQLAGSEAIALMAPGVQEYEERGTPIGPVRTRFFDNFLLSLVPQLRQVVILGAGMDARAFRLLWPSGTHVYELERPEVLKIKESILQNTPAKCHRHVLATDLRQSWSDVLVAHGYQATLPSVWLLEGLLYYLSEAEVNNLLQTISDLSATGSWLGADLVNRKKLPEPDAVTKHWRDNLPKPEEFRTYWRSGFDYPEELFAAYGWKATVLQPGDEGAHFGRYTRQLPREVPNVARNFFVTARKEDS